MEIFHDVTPLVEPLSIDEAFLDVRGARRLWGSPGEIARAIRRAGAARDGHHLQRRGRLDEARREDGVDDLQARRPARRSGGRHRGLPPAPAGAGAVGDRARSRPSRSRHAASTPSPTCSTPRATCSTAPSGPRWASASGTSRAASTRARYRRPHVEKSIGHEETFHEDIADPAYLRAELLRLADRVAGRLRKGGWEASTVAIKVRFSDFTTISRSQTLSEPSDVGQRIGDAARELFASVDLHQAVRLVGVRAEKLRPTGGGGMGLWDDDAEWRRIDGALDDASARFGNGAVTRATFLGRAERRAALPSHPRPAEPSGD